MSTEKGLPRAIQSYDDFTRVCGLAFQVLFFLFFAGYLECAFSWVNSKDIGSMNASYTGTYKDGKFHDAR